MLALIDTQGGGRGDRGARRARGAGEGARPHGRARGEPGPHRRQAAGVGAGAGKPPEREEAGEEGRGQEGPPRRRPAKKAAAPPSAPASRPEADRSGYEAWGTGDRRTTAGEATRSAPRPTSAPAWSARASRSRTAPASAPGPEAACRARTGPSRSGTPSRRSSSSRALIGYASWACRSVRPETNHSRVIPGHCTSVAPSRRGMTLMEMSHDDPGSTSGSSTPTAPRGSPASCGVATATRTTPRGSTTPRPGRRAAPPGILQSTVGVADDGELVAHVGLVRQRPDADVAESGQAVVDPEYRGRHLFTLLKRGRRSRPRATASSGSTARPPPRTRTASAPTSRSGRSRPDCSSGTSRRRWSTRPSTPRAHRQSVVLFYLKTNDGHARPVYPPPRDRAMVERIVERAGLRGTVADAPVDAPRPPHSDIARRRPRRPQRPRHHRARRRRRSARRRATRSATTHSPRRTDCVYVDLPLADPGTQTTRRRSRASSASRSAVCSRTGCTIATCCATSTSTGSPSTPATSSSRPTTAASCSTTSRRRCDGGSGGRCPVVQ